MYYFWANEAQAGPYTLHQVRAMWNSGQINATTIYWQEGMTAWLPLSAIAHIIENPEPVREAPKVPEMRRSSESSPEPTVPLALVHQWVMGTVCLLALIAFFLPNVSVSLPMLGSETASMFDLLTTRPNKTDQDGSLFGQPPSPAAQAPNIWDDVSGTKIGAGGILCGVALILLLAHYVLTIIWFLLAFVFRRTYDFLTFIWLCFAIQFPVLLLIGGQILIGGMKSQMAETTTGNPFARLGQAVVGATTIQPGLVTWFLMALSLGALALLQLKRLRAFD